MDPRTFLTDFVAAHRGTRLGWLFGVPAAFAGRRPFARLARRGIEYRAASTARWVLARPVTGRDYLQLAQQLERAIHSGLRTSD
jgi:hypothetical protein